MLSFQPTSLNRYVALNLLDSTEITFFGGVTLTLSYKKKFRGIEDVVVFESR